ncbi:DUF4190 domain-containing protein [Fodinicola acaciae]|uniref:DUF4190 domain-containing protein n=1 Tax=Fodinicola acaciae TaxID=2681555 RepID=UPI0013D1EE03|nr:DUF4190 domain-containing protein [Fodinicola acaciae]
MTNPYDPYDPYQQQQPQPTTGYGYGGGYPPTRSTNALAIVSMVLSILGIFACGALSLAGAICGHIAINQVRERNEEGEGFAKAGIIVGWIATGLWVVGVVLYILFIVGLVVWGVSQTPTPYTTY